MNTIEKEALDATLKLIQQLPKENIKSVVFHWDCLGCGDYLPNLNITYKEDDDNDALSPCGSIAYATTDATKKSKDPEQDPPILSVDSIVEKDPLDDIDIITANGRTYSRKALSKSLKAYLSKINGWRNFNYEK